MATAAELRAEAARMREFARTVTDPEVLSEVYATIEEWERRAGSCPSSWCRFVM
jgi:hypothetical protein